MNRRQFLTTTGRIASLAMISEAVYARGAQPSAGPLSGPLRVCRKNPRYFTDRSGRAIYLTGSHTWNNLQDMGPTDPPPAFDFHEYLDFLGAHHHNFIRLWRWELVTWNTSANHAEQPKIHHAAPHPWPRTGPAVALDGKPRFDLNRFNDAYFKRLRSRIEAAGQRGIYVSIMLFEGWGLQFVPNGWKAHPFNPANNINGIGKEVNPDGKGLEIYELSIPSITTIQEAYVRRVMDTVHGLDNVLFEISNENHPRSTKWQYHFIRFIHEDERTGPKQHPAGMTFQYRGGSNATLFESPGEWISPNPDAPGAFNYRDNPPPANGRKVVLSDTDHLWGIGGSRQWVWKSFLRGLNPLFMDPYKRKILNRGSSAQWESVRRAMGDTRRFAERMNLAAMSPQWEAASTGYCLAHPGIEYLIYQPKSNESFSVELKPGHYRREWFHPAKSTGAGNNRIAWPGGRRTFKAPFEGDAVLYLKAI